MSTKYAMGNEGFFNNMHDISLATEHRRIYFAVEFTPNKYDPATIDAKIAAAWDGTGHFIKLPNNVKRTAYKTTLITKETDWTLIFYNAIVREESEALGPIWDEVPRRYCTREEADGQWGKWYKYRLRL